MDLNEAVKKNGLGEHEAVAMIWQTVLGSLDSNKREDLIQDQALRYLIQYIPLFAAFTNSMKSEMVLCNKFQEYCYDNKILLKYFNKTMLLFYKTEVLSKEVILKWEWRSLRNPTTAMRTPTLLTPRTRFLVSSTTLTTPGPRGCPRRSPRMSAAAHWGPSVMTTIIAQSRVGRGKTHLV